MLRSCGSSIPKSSARYWTARAFQWYVDGLNPPTGTVSSCCATSDALLPQVRCSPGEIIHLNLRGRRPHALVQDEGDWHALSAIAERMLFWCGGSIHGCRCDGHEIRFAAEMR